MDSQPLIYGSLDAANFIRAFLRIRFLLPGLSMGATFPLMMGYVRERDPQNTESFSFLYLANVLGAMTGTFVTALVLVEVLGFKRTLGMAAAGNGIVALVSGYLGWQQSK